MSRNTPASDPIPDPSESLLPDPPQETEQNSPLFLPPSHVPQPDPSLTEPGESTPPPPSWAIPDAPPESLEPDAESGSSPRSGKAALRRELRKQTRAAVQTVGSVAHLHLTEDGTAERDLGLFLPDADDVNDIADPVAGLLSRRAPSGVENPDVTDLVRLVLAVGAYVSKQVTKIRSVRRAHLMHVDTGADPGHLPTTADPEEDPPASGPLDVFSRRQNVSGVGPGVDVPDVRA